MNVLFFSLKKKLSVNPLRVYKAYLSLFRTRISVPIPLYILGQLCSKDEILDALASGLFVRHMHLVVPSDAAIEKLRGLETDELLRSLVEVYARRDLIVSFFLDINIPFTLSELIANSIRRFYLPESKDILRQLLAILFLDPGVFLLEFDINILFESNNNKIQLWLKLGPLPKVKYVEEGDVVKLCLEDTAFCITDI